MIQTHETLEISTSREQKPPCVKFASATIQFLARNLTIRASKSNRNVSFVGIEKHGKSVLMEVMGIEQNSLGLTTADDIYEVRPREDGDGYNLINDRFRYGPIWYAGPDAVRNAVAYARYRSRSRSHRAIIRVLDASGEVIETHKSIRN
jgi:hypothetical protein